jgi:hypothetical protein
MKPIKPNTARVAKKDFQIKGPEGSNPVTVNAGDPLFVKGTDAGLETAQVHLGGMIYIEMSFHYLHQISREADVDELKKELLHCTCCNRIEVQPGQWRPMPPCFTPRPGVTLVQHNCPACDV